MTICHSGSWHEPLSPDIRPHPAEVSMILQRALTCASFGSAGVFSGSIRRGEFGQNLLTLFAIDLSGICSLGHNIYTHVYIFIEGYGCESESFYLGE